MVGANGTNAIVIHKNEVHLLTYLNVLPLLTVLQTAPQKSVIMLNGISNIEWIDMRPYCPLLETTDPRFYLSLNNDEELYGWLQPTLCIVSTPFLEHLRCVPPTLRSTASPLVLSLGNAGAKMEQTADQIRDYERKLC